MVTERSTKVMLVTSMSQKRVAVEDKINSFSFLPRISWKYAILLWLIFSTSLA